MQVLEDLLRFRKSIYDARNRQVLDDETTNDILVLLDAIETILREALGAERG